MDEHATELEALRADHERLRQQAVIDRAVVRFMFLRLMERGVLDGTDMRSEAIHNLNLLADFGEPNPGPQFLNRFAVAIGDIAKRHVRRSRR